MKRCINLDWVEIHCLEKSGEMSPDYFRHDFEVKVRDYGTPQYAQMFTLSKAHKPLLEIRRLPYSVKGKGGIFDPRSVHIRLCNPTCYWYNPIGFLLMFIEKYEYVFVNITRVDLALDFNCFDNPTHSVQEVITKYLGGEIFKMNQTNLSAHGKSEWLGTSFHSLKWGSEQSFITTKLYNKSLELKQCTDKDYIRAAWINAGLNEIDDVWRLEFSLKGFGQFVGPDELMIDNNLTLYEKREDMLYILFSLINVYFQFRYTEYTRNGTRQRRDRCKMLTLFDVENKECYRPGRILVKTDVKRMERIVYNFLMERASINFDKEDSFYLREAAKIVTAKKYKSVSVGDEIALSKLKNRRLKIEDIFEGLIYDDVYVNMQ